MVEASFSDVLEVIFIFLLIYFGFRVLVRWFGPIILKYILKRVGKKFERNFHQPWQQTPPPSASKARWKKHKNDVEIKKPQQTNRPKTNKDVGEYIDYEEIE